eukprot:355515-Chlamydomonas_euryale.AAC.14
MAQLGRIVRAGTDCTTASVPPLLPSHLDSDGNARQQRQLGDGAARNRGVELASLRVRGSPGAKGWSSALGAGTPAAGRRQRLLKLHQARRAWTELRRDSGIASPRAPRAVGVRHPVLLQARRHRVRALDFAFA